MCIAVYKPKGIKMPSKKIFNNCFSNNDDGAGFMFPVNGKVHLEKGFMSFTAFKKGLKAAIKKYGIAPTDTPMVFHFRITSQGGVKPELTHPFPLSRDYDEMRKLKGDYDVACVHNGIIDFASSFKAVDYNDTMEFIKEVACPLLYKNPNWYKNKSLVGLLTYLLSGNRFAIMDSKGHVELIGNWETNDGIYYSNSSYAHKWKSTTSVLKPYLFDDGYKYGSGYDPYEDFPLITKAMEKEFIETNVMTCPNGDGEQMIITWDKDFDCMIASCPHCGDEYMLTYAAETHAWNKGFCIYDRDREDDYVDDYYGSTFAKGGAY